MSSLIQLRPPLGNLSTDSSGSPDESITTTVKSIQFIFASILMPIIIIIGFVGNILVCMLFHRNYPERPSSSRTKKRRKRLPSHIFLVALAVFDMIFIVCACLWPTIETFSGYSVLNHSVAACKILMYFTSMSDCASVWLIMCLSAERFVVLFYPDYRRLFCTETRAKQATGIVVLVSVLFTSWNPILADIVSLDVGNASNVTAIQIMGCGVQNENKNAYDVLNILDSGLSCFAPSVVILGMNFAIAYQLRKYFDNTIRLALSRALECVNSPNMNFLPIKARRVLREADRQLTKSLVIVSTTYVLLNLPSYVFRILDTWHILQESTFIVIIRQNIYVMYYLHHALNFYLYTFFAPGMRKTMWKLVKRLLVNCFMCECCNFHGCLNSSQLI